MSKIGTSKHTEIIIAGLKSRHRKEQLFKFYGLASLSIGFLLVLFLLFDIVTKATPAFHQHWVKVDVNFSAELLGLPIEQKLALKDPGYSKQIINKANFRKVFKKSVYQLFPKVKGRKNKRQLTKLFSGNAEFTIRDILKSNQSYLNTIQPVWVRLDDDVDSYLKGTSIIGEEWARVSKKQASWVKKLVDGNRVIKRFNFSFFTNSDSREPELAGIRGALAGTGFTLLVTLLLSFPLGVAAAIYLEEFAPRNIWTDFIEVNINNLAAVPSIIFGLLGLAVIINIFGLPRSAPLVGGIVLTLMTLPTIIIASRASIKAVSPAIREAAMGIGASKVQTAFSHVLPIAMPGILTGTIIGIAQALGETAPLLMIGMVAFIVDVPMGVTDAATVMPVQIFLWADSPEKAFLAKTSAAILVLLGILFLMNSIAALLRRKFETKL